MSEIEAKTIVIGGGVGPLAGVMLHRHIIEHTQTDGRDQSHLSVLHISRSIQISDRTEFLVGTDPINPGPVMAEILASVATAEGIAPAKRAVVGVPCNTFHAEPIVGPFRASLEAIAPWLTFVSMIDVTMDTIRQSVPAGTAIGVLSTTGSRRSGVWRNALAAEGMSIIEVSSEEQDTLHRSIYDTDWGLKAITPPSERARETVLGYAQALIDRGAALLISGCTELPFVLPRGSFSGVSVIDPVAELARGLITAAGGRLRH
jgi:aspartate racemase